MNERKLLAIVFIDVVGFTSMASKDESNALFLLDNAVRMLKATVKRYQGRWLKQVGDGSLCSFESAVNAVLCAQEIQRSFSMNDELKLRIGIHIGDVVVTQDDIYGDGVNVAARIQNEAETGGIVVSEEVHNALASHPNINDQLLGETFLKGVGRGLNLYQVTISQDLPTSAIPFELQNQDVLLAGTVGTRPSKLWAGLGLAIIVIIAFWLIQLSKPELPESGLHSIAVLPFKNFTNDPQFDFYGEAISEELLNVLAKSPDLHVASRTSSFDPALKDSSFKTIVDTLQVNYIVEGSLRKTGNTFRVTAQFIRVNDNKHLLSKSYDLVNQNWIQQQIDVSFDYVAKIGEILKLDIDKYLLRTSEDFITTAEQERLYQLMKRAESTDSDKGFNEIIQQLEILIRDNPELYQANAFLCQVYLKLYQLEAGEVSHVVKAQSACELALEGDPYSYTVKLTHANLLLQIGEFEKGLQLVSVIADVFNKRAEPRFIKGAFYFELGEIDKGIESFENGFELKSNYWEPYIDLSFYLISYGLFEQAQIYLSKYINLRPEDPVGYEQLGVVYLYLSEAELADQYFSKALALLPSYSNLSNIGTSKYLTGQYQQAINYYRQALNMDEQDYRVWGNLAEVYRQQGIQTGKPDFEQAITKARASLSVNDRNAATLAALAYFSVAVGNDTFAQQYLKRALEVKEQNFESQYYLAMYALFEKKPEQAIAYLATSVDLGYPPQLLAQAPEFEQLKKFSSFRQLVEF